MVCPICKKTAIKHKSIWKYEFSELIQCNYCGVVHHIRNNILYNEQVHNIYSKKSWGEFNMDEYNSNLESKSITNHLNRMYSNIEFFQDFISEKEKTILDIGAGIGLMEYAIEQKESRFLNKNFVLLEPVVDNYKILRERYPNYLVLNDQLEKYKDNNFIYDYILCQGVDYLFNDINSAFSVMHGLLKENGLLFISRNVFIDMPCYFGGIAIRNFKSLCSGNPLINTYFLENHYRMFLEKNFEIISTQIYNEEYGSDLSVGKHYNYVLKKKNLTYDCSPLSSVKFKELYNNVILGYQNNE